MAANFEYGMDGVAMFATRERNRQAVWWTGSSFFDERLILGDDATTEQLFQMSGFADHFVAKSALVADLSGEVQRVLGLGDLDKLDAKTVRRILNKIQQSAQFVDSHELVYRENDGKHLSVMGTGYTPVQVRDAFSVLDGLVESGDIVLETIGSLADGRKTFMTAKMTGADLEIVPGDVMERYIIVRDSYDGSTTLDYGAAARLIVCENTERMAFGEAKRSGRLSKQKHTKGIMSETRIAQAREALGIASEQFTAYVDLARKLAMTPMSNDEVEAFHTRLAFGDKPIPSVITKLTTSGQKRRMIGELDYLYHHGTGQDLDGRKGTAWGALNSVTEWTNHMKRHKASTTADRTDFVLYGKGAQVNAQARQLLVNQYHVAA